MRAGVLVAALVGHGCGRLGFEPPDCVFGRFGSPVPVPGLDDAIDNWAPQISPDGLTLYWSAWPAATSDLFVATRLSTISSFGPAVALAINAGSYDGQPALSEDGLELFFTSDRAPATARSTFVARRTDPTQPFSTPPDLVGELAGGNTSGPVLSSDGLRIYFYSDRSGDLDLYVAERSDRSTPFAAPTPLAELNTRSNEGAPAISQDEREILFGSDRPGGTGRMDLWRAFRSGVGAPFSTPEWIGELTTALDEESPSLSFDGKDLYFNYASRDEPGGNGDMYVAHRECQ